MDIELELRQMFVLRDPGKGFTDKVLSRVGDVPEGPHRDGVARLADARNSKRGRRLLLGALLVVGVAAAMLPFMPERRMGVPETQETAALDKPVVEALPSHPVASPTEIAADSSGEGESQPDCIDPDVLYGLLLPGLQGQSFRVASVVPPELAGFKPPRQLTWLGATERGAGGTMQVSAVYRSSLAPEAARIAAAAALAADGWELQSSYRPLGNSVFVSARIPGLADTYCREGKPVGLLSSALDGVTYVVLSVSRVGNSAGLISPCDPSSQPVARPVSALDPYMPALALPSDPATGQPVAMRSGGGGSNSDTKRRTSVSFALNASLASVAQHFASQMAAQGWAADASWSGTGTAGSTWTRRMDDDSHLQGNLSVSAFDTDRFTVVFHVVRTK